MIPMKISSRSCIDCHAEYGSIGEGLCDGPFRSVEYACKERVQSESRQVVVYGVVVLAEGVREEHHATISYY